MRLSLLLAAALLAGCTTAKTMMVDDRTAIISADDMGWGGNLSWKVVTTAAEMARARGFEQFQIVSSENSARTGVVAMPGQTTTNTYGNAYCYGAWCSGNATTTTTGTPSYLMPYVRNRKDVVVRFFHAGEAPNEPGVFSVSAILATAK